MATEKENDIGYRIGFFFGTVIRKGVVFLAKLFWAGTVNLALKSKFWMFFHICLVTASIIIFMIFGDISFMMTLIIMLGLALGTWQYIKEYPEIKRRKYFFRVFKEIGLSDGEKYPYYLYERDVSEFIKDTAFHTFIPPHVWEGKKELLEMHLNNKIVDIMQDQSNYRIIHLMIQLRMLPSHVEWADDYIGKDNVLNIGIGYYGLVGMNLEQHPHGFIAGETGSGKSNILKCLIHQALLKDYEIILIDFKRGVSFSSFSDVAKIYYEYTSVMKVLRDMVNETKKRLDIFRQNGIDNLKDYNKVTGGFLPRIIVFIDELAELLKTRDKETANLLTDSIETLTRLSRAVGIHLIMGLQRPDSKIVGGQIKNNVSFRACGRFVDREPSRIMLGNDMASFLPNIKGRFILKDNSIQEVQCIYFPYTNNVVVDDIQRDSYGELEENQKAIDLAEKVVSEEFSERVSGGTKPKGIEFDFSDI